MDLKSCPFCGGEAEYDYTTDVGYTRVFVQCKKCFCRTGLQPQFLSISKQEDCARDVWNRRVKEDTRESFVNEKFPLEVSDDCKTEALRLASQIADAIIFHTKVNKNGMAMLGREEE